MIRAVFNPPFIVALLVLVASALGMSAAINYYNIYLRKLPIYPAPIGGQERVLRAIPTETEHWIRQGKDHIESAETQEVLGTENYLTRFFVEKNPPAGGRPRTVQLHAAYYTGMIDTVPHVPERCFTGGGWSLVGGPWTLPIPLDTSAMRPAEFSPEDVAGEDSPLARYQGRVYTVRLSNRWSTAGGGRRVNLPYDLTPERPLELRISQYRMPGSDRPFFAGYFFVANGGWRASAEQLRLLAFDLRTDYAYYLKVQVGSSDVNSPEELAQVAGSLLDDLLGELMTCVPDWMDVERGVWPPDNPKRRAQPLAGR